MKDHLIFDVSDANTILDSDSVGAYLRSSDGTLITHTTDGSREAVDVFTELGYAEDSAHSSGDWGAMALAVRDDAGGSLVSADGDYSPLSVDADGNLRVNATVNIDSNSDKDEDAAHSSGDAGEFVLSVRMADVDGSNSALLAGTEGDYQAVFTNDKGELHVRDNDAVDLLATIDADTSLVAAATHLEDAAHSSGDRGVFPLSVRVDDIDGSNSAFLAGTEGDYQALLTDAKGALYTNITNDLIVDDTANTAILSGADTLTAAGTAEKVVASNLANRKYLFVYNFDNRKMYIGGAAVDKDTGFPISPGAYMELRAGASVDVYYDSEKSTHAIRTLEQS